MISLNISSLPPEIMHDIFIFLSDKEDLKKVSLVCKSWKTLIDSELFKKRYGEVVNVRNCRHIDKLCSDINLKLKNKRNFENVSLEKDYTLKKQRFAEALKTTPSFAHQELIRDTQDPVLITCYNLMHKMLNP